MSGTELGMNIPSANSVSDSDSSQFDTSYGSVVVKSQVKKMSPAVGNYSQSQSKLATISEDKSTSKQGKISVDSKSLNKVHKRYLSDSECNSNDQEKYTRKKKHSKRSSLDEEISHLKQNDRQKTSLKSANEDSDGKENPRKEKSGASYIQSRSNCGRSNDRTDLKHSNSRPNFHDETDKRDYRIKYDIQERKRHYRRNRTPPRKDDKYDKKSDRNKSDKKSSEREVRGKQRDKLDSIRNKEDGNESDGESGITERQRRTVDLLTSRTGGAYIPPAKLRILQAEITDKSSAAYQRIAWEALKKSIHGYINKVNVDNIGIITRELLKENIIRGRGLLCRSIIQAQAASPTFTHVYAALVAIINSKFPNIGDLLLKRLIIQFKRGFRRNDKSICISASRFIAHLVNQRVAHEILALEILTLLVEAPTDDSVEVAIAFLKECGMKLTEVSAKGVNAIFEMLKNILHEGKLDKRVQYMIEVVFQVRKDGFKDHESVIEALELVEEDDQFTHLIMLDEATNAEDALNVFKFDDKYETNEDKYKELSKGLLGSDLDESGSNSSGSYSEDSDENDEEKLNADIIIDNTETNLVALRRTIYLTIHSSLDYEECAHKLMKMQLKPGQEMELCHMFLDCCAEQRTYEKFYGLLAQRFATINKVYVPPFEDIFRDTYHTTHRLDTNRLRNVSKFFAHLLFTDAIGWDILECIKLNEDDTTSSSRIFIKILFQELAEYMGLSKLNERLKDNTLSESFSDLFPRDNPRNTRFAINFFTSIGLGGLTDELREFLKSAPKPMNTLINKEVILSSSSDSIPSSTSDSTSSSSTNTSSDSDTKSDSDLHDRLKKRKKTKKRKIESKKGKQKQVSSSSSSDVSGIEKNRPKKKGNKTKINRKNKSLQRNRRYTEDKYYDRRHKNEDENNSIRENDRGRRQVESNSKQSNLREGEMRRYDDQKNNRSVNRNVDNYESKKSRNSDTEPRSKRYVNIRNSKDRGK